jgi:uncharacterized protein YjbJ (UPF0337 family)
VREVAGKAQKTYGDVKEDVKDEQDRKVERENV